MKTNLKIVLLTFIFSLPFWWGMNILGDKLEDFFFWQKLAKDQIFAAQISLEQQLLEMGPIYKNGVGEPGIEAKSIISVFVGETGQNKILFQRNTEEKLPIASLTKLITAMVYLDANINSQKIVVMQQADEVGGARLSAMVESFSMRCGEPASKLRRITSAPSQPRFIGTLAS